MPAMATINAAGASAIGAGSIDLGSSSNRGAQRVFCSGLVAPSLWSRRITVGSSCGRANHKNQSERGALEDAEVLASRDSMEEPTSRIDNGEIFSGWGRKPIEDKEESDSPMWISRGNLEDTDVSDARDVLHSFSGGDERNDGGKVGTEAFDHRQQKELDDIEQQYVLNDKLSGSESGVKAAEESIPGNSEAVGKKLRNLVDEIKSSGNLEDGSGEESGKNSSASMSENSDNAGVVNPGSLGRDWRVFSGGTNYPASAKIDKDDVKNPEDKSKEVLGWSENKCDDGSQLKKSIESVENSDRLGCLEELVMKKDNGKSAEDYNRRATIFEKSGEVFRDEKSMTD